MLPHLPLVRQIAAVVGRKLPPCVDLGDLEQAGVFGLADALKSYDPSRGVKFNTYATPRIRGSMLDWIRENDWVPRLVRSRSTKMERANRGVVEELGRPGTRDELAARMKVPLREFDRIEQDSQSVGLVSLSRKWFETDSGKDLREVDQLTDPAADQRQREFEGREAFARMVRCLPATQRHVMTLYYREGLTMKEAGRALGFSESRTSQVHAAALAILKSEMTRQGAVECGEAA